MSTFYDFSTFSEGTVKPTVIRIDVVSSPATMSVNVDGVSIVKKYSTNTEVERGIHITVLDEATGKQVDYRSFDTCINPAASDALVNFVNSVPVDRIVVVAVRDEASIKLQQSAKEALTKLGSGIVATLSVRQNWAMITQKKSSGGELFAEATGYPLLNPTWPQFWAYPGILLTTKVPLQTRTSTY